MVAEEALVEKMLKAIGQNMDNLDYTVDLMASDIGMSRANLYKKNTTDAGHNTQRISAKRKAEACGQTTLGNH